MCLYSFSDGRVLAHRGFACVCDSPDSCHTVPFVWDHEIFTGIEKKKKKNLD